MSDLLAGLFLGWLLSELLERRPRPWRIALVCAACPAAFALVLEPESSLRALFGGVWTLVGFGLFRLLRELTSR